MRSLRISACIDGCLEGIEVCNRRVMVLIGLVSGMLSACAMPPLADVGREPTLSSVGSGLHPMRATDQSISKMGGANIDHVRRNMSFETNSLWSQRGADLFRDPRARHIGDILTVTISMKDKASLDNSSKRSKDSSHGLGLDVSHSIDAFGMASKGTATGASNIKANTATDGKGAIARSESIDLRVAAVVTDVLPNGNLIIQGSQELLVNYELRILTITGIVNAVEIKTDNTVSYERIAEARLSYGGRGRVMEVQQPGWGHQILDIISPF